MSEGFYFVNHCDFMKDTPFEIRLKAIVPHEDRRGSQHKRRADIAGRCLQCMCGYV